MASTDRSHEAPDDPGTTRTTDPDADGIERLTDGGAMERHLGVGHDGDDRDRTATLPPHEGDGEDDGQGPQQEAAGTGGESAPDAPTDLPKRSWFAVLRRTVREFKDDNLVDWAASLTYYGILALFPAALAIVSLVGLAGDSTTQKLIDNVEELAPGGVRDTVTTALEDLQSQSSGAGVLFVVGLLVAMWSASRYVAAFMRAANAIYDVDEGRPFWKMGIVRFAVTLVVVVLLVVASAAVVFTGPVAEQVGDMLGLESVAVTAWSIAKWPLLMAVVVAIFAILYWASPNVRQPHFRWLSPGAAAAIVMWLVASAAFAVYVANFGSYNETYGTFGGVIIFLVWLWISNLAILLGAEFDAELARERHIQAGHPASEEPFLEPRDTRAMRRG